MPNFFRPASISNHIKKSVHWICTPKNCKPKLTVKHPLFPISIYILSLHWKLWKHYRDSNHDRLASTWRWHNILVVILVDIVKYVIHCPLSSSHTKKQAKSKDKIAKGHHTQWRLNNYSFVKWGLSRLRACQTKKKLVKRARSHAASCFLHFLCMNDSLSLVLHRTEVSTDATRRTRRGASEAARGMYVMCCGPLLVPLPKAHWWHGEHYLANETGSIDLAIGHA